MLRLPALVKVHQGAEGEVWQGAPGTGQGPGVWHRLSPSGPSQFFLLCLHLGQTQVTPSVGSKEAPGLLPHSQRK